jgi:hypothetical protein
LVDAEKRPYVKVHFGLFFQFSMNEVQAARIPATIDITGEKQSMYRNRCNAEPTRRDRVSLPRLGSTRVQMPRPTRCVGGDITMLAPCRQDDTERHDWKAARVCLSQPSGRDGSVCDSLFLSWEDSIRWRKNTEPWALDGSSHLKLPTLKPGGANEVPKNLRDPAASLGDVRSSVPRASALFNTREATPTSGRRALCVSSACRSMSICSSSA